MKKYLVTSGHLSNPEGAEACETLDQVEGVIVALVEDGTQVGDIHVWEKREVEITTTAVVHDVVFLSKRKKRRPTKKTKTKKVKV